MHFSAHWDPFSDAITAGPEFNKSAGIIKQQIEKLWCWPAFANMAIFTRLSKNGKGQCFICHELNHSMRKSSFVALMPTIYLGPLYSYAKLAYNT